ncbi:MAG: spore germination protein, partial [Clostridiales bacterium]|nr:spore germination protein [Clostridiales bacterium]
RTIMDNSMDLNIMEVEISGHKCAVITIESMISTVSMSQIVFGYLMDFKTPDCTGQRIFDFITKESLLTTERKTIYTYGDLTRFAYSGFGVILIDGISKAVVLGIQGYDKRSIAEPTGEMSIKGAQEGFTEVIRTNISLIRRRLKTPTLKFEMMQIGSKSKTDVCIAYISDKASSKYVDRIRRKLSKIKLETVLTSGYIQPFLEGRKKSIFSDSLTTERPDVFCTKLNEGKVGILIDGTPYTIVCPSVFSENFMTMDDYATKPFYSTYIRLVRYASFFLAVIMPGLYVALVTFHPETFTHKLLLILAISEETTPYPLFMEVFIIMIMYEILREAGIRLPRAVGGAVSIVGGLIIGDAAVKSGLVAAPILILIGLTATSSFVIPTINEQTSILRLLFIIAGGTLGLFGIGIASSFLIINVCAMNTFGIPYSAPLSPYTNSAFKEAIIRPSFRKFAKKKGNIKDYNGAD